MWTSTQLKNSSGGIGIPLLTVKFTINLLPNIVTDQWNQIEYRNRSEHICGT